MYPYSKSHAILVSHFSFLNQSENPIKVVLNVVKDEKKLTSHEQDGSPGSILTAKTSSGNSSKCSKDGSSDFSGVDVDKMSDLVGEKVVARWDKQYKQHQQSVEETQKNLQKGIQRLEKLEQKQEKLNQNFEEQLKKYQGKQS